MEALRSWEVAGFFLHPSIPMSDFRTGRQTVRDQIQRYSNPNYGRDAFMDMVGEAAPTVDSFLARQAANGGSEQMAREQAQSARQQTFAQGMGAYNQMQRSAQQTAASLAQGLMNDQRQRQQFQAQMEFKRNQANKGGGLMGILGQIGGTALGSLAGPLGAKAGSELGSQLFGNGGGPTNSNNSGLGGSKPFTSGPNFG